MGASAQGPVGRDPGNRRLRTVPARELADVTLKDHDGVSVARVSGEVDMSSVDRVAAALTDLSNLALGLVVDLSAVDYLDSSGISLLHDVAQRLRRRSQMLVIVSPPGSPPRRMLELTALDSQAVVVNGVEPAIEAVRDSEDGGSLAGGLV
jgi:stage II sporulation protein AA (anti-sigma F factor antagonist)